jgi:hypothetical protein
MYGAPLRRIGAETLLVNYEQIDANLLERVLEHFGLRPDREHVDRAARLLRYDAKSGRGERRFRPDAEAKRCSAPRELVALAEQWLRRPYEELERRRAGDGWRSGNPTSPRLR